MATVTATTTAAAQQQRQQQRGLRTLSPKLYIIYYAFGKHSMLIVHMYVLSISLAQHFPHLFHLFPSQHMDRHAVSVASSRCRISAPR